MGEKDIYIERLSEQLERWKAEIMALDVKAESAEADVRENCAEALDELKDYYESTAANVAIWLESGDETWDVLEANAEQKMESATSVIKNAIQHIKRLLG